MFVQVDGRSVSYLEVSQVGVAYVVLAVDGWYEQIDERLKSRAVNTHFGLKVLDQLLIRGIELDAIRQYRPILLRLASVIPVIWYSMYDQSTVLSE